MSAFWKYFAETLRWPQIHLPGALQALTRGLAGHLDATRDDALYLREQFFPIKAEGTILPGHGDSRGITRHTSETDAQFRARVVHAWRWHNLGGKTMGLPEILEFYGYPVARIENSAKTIPSKWAEFQIELREPATQAEQDLMLNQMDTLIWLANEYKPARSRLARIYHGGYDIRPLILDRKWGLDRNFLDGESGIYYPENGVVVSFGYRVRSQTLPEDRTPFMTWTEFCSCIVDYLKTCQLDRFRLDVPLLQPPQINAAHIEAAEIEATDHSHVLDYGRSISRVQLALDWTRLDGVNARLDRPHIVRVGNPVRLDRYRLDASIDRRVIPIHELFHSLVRHAATERTAFNALAQGMELFSGEVFFDLHNPRHRGQQLDNVLLDSPRRERFGLADGRLQADFVPEPRRWFDTAYPSREISRSQFAVDACRLDVDARFDGPHVTEISNPVRLDRYRLDASIGKTTRPLPYLRVELARMGVAGRAETAPLWAETGLAPASVPAEARQPQQAADELSFAAPRNLPLQTRSLVATLDSAVALDTAYIHGRPFDAAASLGGAESASILATRDAAEVAPQLAVARLDGLGDPARVPPALWASGWTARPWMQHFGYLQASPPLPRLPADSRLDSDRLDRSLCQLNPEEQS